MVDAPVAVQEVEAVRTLTTRGPSMSDRCHDEYRSEGVKNAA